MLLTVAIAAPLYSRSFYYAQVESIKKETGYSSETITQAYDEVMDYLTLHKKFGTGDLAYSEEGKAHFKDCQRLFDINLIVLVLSIVAVITLGALDASKKIKLAKPKGFNLAFYAGICAIALPLILASLCAINFERAFEVFHKILFPGKDNWVFESGKDAIIDILPISYFRNCAILIGCILVTLSAVAITITAVIRKRSKASSV